MRSSLKDDRRAALLAAARQEFAQLGLDLATMRGIARRAGCTTGAVYPVFASKQALYAALLAQSLQRLDAHVTAAITASTSARRQVHLGCRAFVDYYLAHDFEVNLGLYAFGGVKRRGVGKEADLALNRTLIAVLERIAEPMAAARAMTVASARPLATLLFSQMIGSVVLQLAGRLDILRTDASSLLALQLRLLLPPASRSRKQPN